MVPINSTIPAQTVLVDLGPRSYPIYIGTDILPHLGQAFATHCRSTRAVVITDEHVAGLYAQTALDSLKAAALDARLISIPPGESSKSLARVEAIYDQLFDFTMERNDAVVALGGGVIGDLAGFVAATFKRGIPYVQVPTTLLAMVDSSIGGKTGINHPRGKNMIGAFHQPQMVLADTNTLRSLPPRELGCGLAETVKHAVIRDGQFFEHLEKHTRAILDLDQQLIIDLVVRNCRIKASVVAADECESGLRGILNFGHTIGHTFETVLTRHDFHHGEAVALGMVAAARLACRRNLITAPIAQRLIDLLAAFHLPTATTVPLPIDQLFHAMLQDKKITAGKIKFVLPTALGSCAFVKDLTESEIKAAIASLNS